MIRLRIDGKRSIIDHIRESKRTRKDRFKLVQDGKVQIKPTGRKNSNTGSLSWPFPDVVLSGQSDSDSNRGAGTEDWPDQSFCIDDAVSNRFAGYDFCQYRPDPAFRFSIWESLLDPLQSLWRDGQSLSHVWLETMQVLSPYHDQHGRGHDPQSGADHSGFPCDAKSRFIFLLPDP